MRGLCFVNCPVRQLVYDVALCRVASGVTTTSSSINATSYDVVCRCVTTSTCLVQALSDRLSELTISVLEANTRVYWFHNDLTTSSAPRRNQLTVLQHLVAKRCICSMFRSKLIRCCSCYRASLCEAAQPDTAWRSVSLSVCQQHCCIAYCCVVETTKLVVEFFRLLVAFSEQNRNLTIYWAFRLAWLTTV